MIRCNRYVRRTAPEHPEQRSQYTSHRGNVLPRTIAHFRQRIIMPKQLIGAIDKVHFHN